LAGQLLGDGGLALNAPVEPMLEALEQSGGTILVADLFARDGGRPDLQSLSSANQTPLAKS
jgi:hypothetical protein